MTTDQEYRDRRSTHREIPVDELRAQLSGELITPEDAAYDEARQVFFKGYDRTPLAVARVAGAEDVARVVTAAREGGLELAVRSGGHSWAGYGTSDGGLVIDLSAMKAMEIDTEAGPSGPRPGSRRASSPPPPGSAGSPPASGTRARSASVGSRSPAESGSSSAGTGSRSTICSRPRS